MIEVNGLVFTYRGAKEPAVNDLEFSVGDGEIFGFLGPNGAGKSTTQKVLIGLLRDYQGKVSILGRESRPRTLTLPMYLRSKPMSTFCVVLLPAPFGPRTPKISPSPTENSTSFTAGSFAPG